MFSHTQVRAQANTDRHARTHAPVHRSWDVIKIAGRVVVHATVVDVVGVSEEQDSLKIFEPNIRYLLNA